MAKYKVGYLVGSLAKASIDRQLARALVRLAPPELEMTEIPFGIVRVLTVLPRSP